MIRHLAMKVVMAGFLTSAVWAGDTTDPFKPPAIETRNIPVVPGDLVERIRQYQNVRSAGFDGWSPDGKGILVGTRFGNTTQLHRVYEPGGRREQVTFFEEPVDGRFLPGDESGTLLLSMSAGGDENYQVFRLDRRSGETVQLTDGNSRNLLGPVTDDGRRAVVASNKRNGRDTDLYVLNPQRADSLEMVLETDGEYWIPLDWSPDGTQLLINRYVSINETYPAILDVKTGKKRPIPLGEGERTSVGSMKFSSDGESVFMTSDSRGEFRQLARFDLDSFEFDWLTAEISWNVQSIEVQRPSGNLVAFTTNEDGASRLYLMASDKPQRVFAKGARESIELEPNRPHAIDLPLGIISSLEFSPDGTRLGFTLSRPDAPADAYALNLSNGELVRWTYSEVGGLDTSQFVTPSRIAFESFDGRKIPAYYFRPKGASKDDSVPVLINIHGGPEGQYRPYFSSLDQFYLNELGIAVIRPNVRGSAGYGKSYLLLDNGPKREDSVRDIGALLDWVAAQPELDASRVAVIGGSYGGYMVLASLTHFPEKIKAGVDIVGIASFTTFLKNTSEYRRDLRRAEYGDERDLEMAQVFERINPTNNAHKIRSELFVAHGKNDPRVPFSEAVQIVEVVENNGGTPWTLYADNEGHGFGKKANRDYLTAAIALFLRESLIAP